LQDGAIRYVKFGEFEIVRRIYMALRDQNWNTVPTVFSDWKYDVKVDSFDISFVAENRQGAINYKWHGSIVGDSHGKITYSMSGSAQSDFKKRIIGLCVLFPIRECAGQRATVLRQNGEKLQTSFPYNISSQQPLPGFDDVDEVNYLADGIPVSVKFDGDQFEMEDQRSFTDASFKVYSTWNRAAVEGDSVDVGEKFSQMISVSIGSTEISQARITSHDPITIEPQTSESYLLPKIGLGASSVDKSLTENEAILLRNLRMTHLRCDLDLCSKNWDAILNRACLQAKQLGVSLELALFVNSKEAKTELEIFKLELEKLQPSVSSILVFDNGEPATSIQSLKVCRELFTNYKSHPKIGGGTNRNYFDLHLAHPAFEPKDLVSYSVNPQVHAFDVSSLVETLEGQSWTLNSAHKIYPKSPVAISPVTLKPRFNPDEVVAESNIDPNKLPPQVDSRQMSLYGACWTAGSIKSFAEFGADSLTYYETVGWRGVLETDSGPPMPVQFFSKPRMVFPLYHVLADVCEMAGGRVVPTKSSRPLSADAFSIAGDKGLRVIAYNLTWLPQNVSLRGVKASQVRMRRLSEESATEAISNALEFRKRVSEPVKLTEPGILNLSLMPYEVVTLDFE